MKLSDEKIVANYSKVCYTYFRIIAPIKEFVNVEREIARYKYEYHFIRGKEIIFRYDNADDPKARGLITYPHHKHHGSMMLKLHGPTLKEVLLEIADIAA